MLVFGFDPSLTNFGWVLCDITAKSEPDRVLAKGRFHTTSDQEEVDRFTDLRQHLESLLEKYPDVARVSTETPYFGAEYSEGLYALFIQVQQAVKTAKRDIVFLAPSQVQAFGRQLLSRPSWWSWDKADSIESARTFSDRKKWTNDEADAYLVAKLGARFWEVVDGVLPKEELSPYERKAFFKEVRRRTGKVDRTGLIFKEGSRFFRWTQEEEYHGEIEERESSRPKQSSDEDAGLRKQGEAVSKGPRSSD